MLDLILNWWELCSIVSAGYQFIQIKITFYLHVI